MKHDILLFSIAYKRRVIKKLLPGDRNVNFNQIRRQFEY